MPATTTKPKRTTARLNTATVSRCQHLRADGKRCADAVYPGHASLCHYHLNQQMGGIANGDIIAADILHAIGNFQSAAAINVALGKIFLYQLTGRISRQDAMALSYQCQLLLQTLPLIKEELKEIGFSKYWREETQRILGESSDLDQITFPSLLPESEVPLHPKAWVNPKPTAPTATPPPPTNPTNPPTPTALAAPVSPAAPAIAPSPAANFTPSQPSSSSSTALQPGGSVLCSAGRSHGFCGSSALAEESPALSNPLQVPAPPDSRRDRL